MNDLFAQVADECSSLTTRAYSTSFSLATSLFPRRTRRAIYAIYGFVRFADEIVDTFHEHDQRALLEEFRAATHLAIERRVSTNPILHSFQRCVHSYGIDRELIDAFFHSMEADLTLQRCDEASYHTYVYGSAEVVGLMCLRVFLEGDDQAYRLHADAARALGAAFQKVNFLRDLKHDYDVLGRSYFPGVNFSRFDRDAKAEIEREIEADFSCALPGIHALPPGARLGVYVAYVYYRSLFRKLVRLPPERLREERIRVPNVEKLFLLALSWCRMRVGWL